MYIKIDKVVAEQLSGQNSITTPPLQFTYKTTIDGDTVFDYAIAGAFVQELLDVHMEVLFLGAEDFITL